MKLRYVGTVFTTFITGSVGTVQPGEEFSVPDELAPAFTARVDVEEVTEDEPTAVIVSPPKPSKKEPGQSVATDGGDPEKMSEENSGVPDDH